MIRFENSEYVFTTKLGPQLYNKMIHKVCAFMQ